MNNQEFTYANVVAEAPAIEQKEFYKQTYLHLALALMVTVLLEYAILTSSMAGSIVNFMFNNYIISFLLFFGATWLGQSMAYSADKGKQYLGLGIYVLAYTLFFAPILALTAEAIGVQIIQEAAILTTALFAGLTVVAFTSKSDFSFLEGALKIGSFIIIGVIIASFFIGGLTSSIFWIGGVILFLGGLILYETSQIKYKYPTTMFVGAAATLYGSFMTLFLYVLRLLMALRD